VGCSLPGGLEAFFKVSGWSSEYKSLDKVLRHYKRRLGSEKTKENLLNFLKGLCVFSGRNPDELATLSVSEASEVVQAYLDSLADKDRSIRYINVATAYIKTFFRVNGFEGERELRVERYFQPSRYRKRPEYVPMPEEIQRMAYAAGSKRNMAVILTLYTSGLRVSTLQALIYGDIREELEKGLEVIKIPVYPEMKRRILGACKGGIPYYTFASKMSVEVLREYLQERVKEYGGIEDGEPLFCSDTTNVPAEKRRKTPIMKKTLEQLVKRAAFKAGIKQWRNVTPHCFRKAFESALRNNGIDLKDQEFLMGHILPGTQDTYYDYTKVEDLRAKYSSIKFFKTAEVDKLEMIKAFAQTLGIDKIEIKIQKIKEKQSELDEMAALGKIIREELGLRPLETRMVKYRKENNNSTNCKKYETKIVSENELLPYLDEGWNIIKELKNKKLVIRRKLTL
jgi:integrase